MRRYWNKEVRFRCDFYHYSPESAAFDLGLERAGMRCVGQVEIEPFCQKVLAKHWPDVWRWNDVKTLTGETVRQHCETVDLLCGGVPCQPASVAGKRKGAADHRWLWPDFLRLVSEVKPMFVLAENPRGVTSLRVEGMQFSEWIAREFAARGYELLPVELAAEDVGASQRRERIFFVAYRSSMQPERRGKAGHLACEAGITEGDGAKRKWMRNAAEHCCSDVANADSVRQQQPGGTFTEGGQWIGNGGQALADASGAGRQERNAAAVSNQPGYAAGGDFARWPARPGQPQHEWEEPRVIESALGCAATGLSERLARRHRVASLKALGNAIVPQVAEVIGRAIMEASQNELR
jgi:DNA (cytosine-5)-methyltransferase 1